MLGQECFIGEVGVAEGLEQVGVDRAEVRLEGQGRPVGGDPLLGPALLLEDVPQGVEGVGPLGIEGQGLAAAALGLGERALGQEQHPQVVPGDRIARVQGHGPAVAGQGLGQASPPVQEQA